MKFSDLLNRRFSVVVSWKDVTVTVTYRLEVLGRKRWAGLAAPDSDLATVLAELLESWDITDDAGDPLPVTRETLDELPVPLMRAMLRAVIEHASADEGES